MTYDPYTMILNIPYKIKKTRTILTVTSEFTDPSGKDLIITDITRGKGKSPVNLPQKDIMKLTKLCMDAAPEHVYSAADYTTP
jgi:hypothetical protein